MEIGRNHPLRTLFRDLVRRHFFEGVRVDDPRVNAYITDLLVEFAQTENLLKIRNSRGRQLDDVGEMLLASDPLGEAESFDRERAVRKHIGDYTLFLTGMFPEYVTAYRRRWKPAPDVFVDYMKVGRESYYVVSCFDQFEYRKEAPVFRRLSEKFEMCVYGLHLVREDLKRRQQDVHQQMQRLLEDPPIA